LLPQPKRPLLVFVATVDFNRESVETPNTTS
jgi:hypothetical protein